MPKISELPSGVPTTVDSLPLVQSGATKKATFNDLPISSAQQAALNLKADANNSTLTGTTTAATINTTNVTVSGTATINGTLTGTAVTKSAVGLGNVDNTSDVNKPVSTAQAAAIAAMGGFKNKLRNAKMEVAQRGGSFPAVANGAYTVDGWWFNGTAGVVTVSQQADVPANAEYQFSLRSTVTTAKPALAAGDFAALCQSVEGFLIRDLVGNPVAISFDVRSAKTGTHCVALVGNGADTRSYVFTYTVNAVNTWERKVLTLPAGLITAGTWNYLNGTGLSLRWTYGCGATLSAPAANAWQTGTYLGLSSQANGLDTVGNIFAIGAPQLERDRGQGATSLEHVDPALETLRNQRYYETGRLDLRSNGTAAGGAGSFISFCTGKRAIPTMVIASSAYPYGCSAGTLSAGGTNGFEAYVTATGAWAFSANWTASSEL